MRGGADNQPDDALLSIARVRAWQADGATHLRLRPASPVMTFIIVLVVEAVVLGFAYPIMAMLYNPKPIPLLLMILVGGVAVVAAVVLAVLRYNRISTGEFDLVIRDDARTIALPANFGREFAMELSLDDVLDIAPADEVPVEAGGTDSFERKKYEKRAIRPDEQLRPTGHRGEIKYAVVICTRDADGASEKLLPVARWTEFRRANALALWLNQRLDREPVMPIDRDRGGV